MPGLTWLASTTSKGGNSKSCKRGLVSTEAAAIEEGQEVEEEEKGMEVTLDL